MSSALQRRSATAISPEQELALLHLPAPLRNAFRALFEIDAAMGDVVARSTDPALARIKLAWWREQLEALDEAPPPAEPRLQAVSRWLLPRGIAGSHLAKLEPGWATLLDEERNRELVGARGVALFEIGGKLLGAEDSRLADAGALYALASIGESAEAYRQRLQRHRFAPELRPLTMLARAAARRGGSRRLALSMLAHRWSGRVC